MPKSKDHFARKMKKRKERDALHKWAQRKAAEVEALSDEELKKRWTYAPWRRNPEVIVSDVNVNLEDDEDDDE